MKKPKRLRRIPSERTKSQNKGPDLNSLIKKTIESMRTVKVGRTVRVKRSGQRGLFNVEFSLPKPPSTEFLVLLREYLKQEGLIAQRLSLESVLNNSGTNQRTVIRLQVRFRKTDVDVGKRQRKTFKKVLAFIGDNEYGQSRAD